MESLEMGWPFPPYYCTPREIKIILRLAPTRLRRLIFISRYMQNNRRFARFLSLWSKRELVIREKRLLEQNPCSRGQLRPLCDYWRSLGLRGYTPYKLELYLIDKINSALKSAVCSFGSFGLSLRSSSSLLASPRFLADKKKAPVIGFLVPFYAKHSKGFLSA